MVLHNLLSQAKAVNQEQLLSDCFWPKAPGHESGVGSAGQAAALKTLSDQQLIGAKGYLSVD